MYDTNVLVHSFYLPLTKHLLADIQIDTFQGKPVNLNRTEACAVAIGPYGLAFVSDLDFPENPDFVLSVTLQIQKVTLNLKGHVIKTIPVGKGRNAYECEWHLQGLTGYYYLRVLDQFSRAIGKNGSLPIGSTGCLESTCFEA